MTKVPRACTPIAATLLVMLAAAVAGAVEVDFSDYQAAEGIVARREGERIAIAWKMSEGDAGRLVLDLRPGQPLIESLGTGKGLEGEVTPILRGVDPVTFVTVGTRVAPADRPPGMSPFNTFFDAPAKRPHETARAKLDLKKAWVRSQAGRVTVILEGLAAGPFSGDLEMTVYEGSGLIQVEAVLSTTEDRRAYLYDAGLVAAKPSWKTLAWEDSEGHPRREEIDADAPDRALAVRHRAIAAGSEAGSVACFPPPHQFFTPRDLTDNLKTAWSGRGHRKLDDRTGFGVRQSEDGGGSFAPWFNAPPSSRQRMGVFYLVSKGSPEDALAAALKYTNGDRFPAMPGHLTFTSHWHMATAVAAMAEKARGGERSTPDFVKMFKDMGVNVVHLAEFHGDGHPQDPGPLRLPEMEAMFDECRRLSDGKILFLPGEEANVHLGPTKPGNGGHWLYLFPKPVAWTMRRGPDQPFSEDNPTFGNVYHVGDRADMLRLLETEHGLAWTAHPRIKASTWAPDIYRAEDFYRSDAWLGAAWKAMPADLSSPRLGARALDLLDDMANWGGRKYLLGEVDVFKIDRTHELFGHMNVNYVKLDRLPRFDDGWPEVLDALRKGRFFVTTGEVLLHEFTVGGKSGGEILTLDEGGDAKVRIDYAWTFPLHHAELISGDGRRVFRQELPLGQAHPGPFGRSTHGLSLHLEGRKWVRLEVWDVAGNGAFSQPVWLEPPAQ